MIFDLGNDAEYNALIFKAKSLKEKGATVELKEKRKIRTDLQNRALHLFFEQVANELNSLGITFNYTGLKGMEMELRFTKEIFKEFTWKPIQKVMFGTDSTKKLKRDQIDPIIEVINKFFADRGVVVSFPNKFDQYLEFYEKKNS